jgi:hypothetical protein
MNVCHSFERMEMNRDSVGSLKSYKILIDPLRFGSVIYYWFSYKAWNLVRRCAL